MIEAIYHDDTKSAICKITGNAEHVAKEYAAIIHFMKENYPTIKWYAEKIIDEEGVKTYEEKD